MRCPKCDQEMERIDDEPDVGIHGCWFCHNCDEGHDLEDEENDPRDWQHD